MGSAATKPNNSQVNKTIYIKVLNNVQKVTFSAGCSSRDLQDQLAALCGLPRGTAVLLKDKHGAHITVSPAMRTNTAQDTFIVDAHTYRQKVGGGKDEVVNNAVAAVAAQLQKVFRIEELRADFEARITSLEKRLENSKRVIEIEKFKYEIADIRDAFLTHQKTRHVDFTRL
ncbi:High affinity cGMP-specific 3',5'-cyclic phosphodiesterase 9A-like 2, partial [Homarus americanus]